jgi:CBS domain-containing protein
MRAVDVMTTEVITVDSNTSVQALAALLSERGIHHIGDRHIAIFRHDLSDVSKGCTQLIELIGGIGPVSLTPCETELDVARLHECGHQIAERGRVLLCISWARHFECC